MHLKVFLKLKKPLKTLSSGQIYKKKPKKPKNTHWVGFFFLTRVFSNPAFRRRGAGRYRLPDEWEYG